MLGQTVAEIEQSGKGIIIKTAEGNTFYIPNGVAVIPISNTSVAKILEEMSELSLAESNRRFIEHATRKYVPNIICKHGMVNDHVVIDGTVRTIEFDKLSREEKANLCDESMLVAMNDMSRHICDVCRLDRSTCGYIPENPQNCEGHYLSTPKTRCDDDVPY